MCKEGAQSAYPNGRCRMSRTSPDNAGRGVRRRRSHDTASCPRAMNASRTRPENSPQSEHTRLFLGLVASSTYIPLRPDFSIACPAFCAAGRAGMRRPYSSHPRRPIRRLLPSIATHHSANICSAISRCLIAQSRQSHSSVNSWVRSYHHPSCRRTAIRSQYRRLCGSQPVFNCGSSEHRQPIVRIGVKLFQPSSRTRFHASTSSCHRGALMPRRRA